MWWYELLFTFLPFTPMFLSKVWFFNKKVKLKMFIVVIWLSLYCLFFFAFIFQSFSSACFNLFLNVFFTPSPNQENPDSK